MKIEEIWKIRVTRPDESPRQGVTVGALGLAVVVLVLFAFILAVNPADAQCVYAKPEYSVYNRLLKVTVIRFDQEVGTVHFSYQFNGYYVRCTTGGISPRRFFSRARDARWAACDACY